MDYHLVLPQRNDHNLHIMQIGLMRLTLHKALCPAIKPDRYPGYVSLACLSHRIHHYIL